MGAQQRIQVSVDLLQEAAHQESQSENYVKNLLHTKQLCDDMSQRDHSTTRRMHHISRIVAKARALPKAPWKLNERLQLQASYRQAEATLKDVARSAVHSEDEVGGVSRGHLRDENSAVNTATEALLGPR